MSYKVEITYEGRCGWYHYIEDGKRLSFDWEFSTVGITIFVPTPEEWDAYCEEHRAAWAKGRRQEILQRLAEEVRRRKVKSAKIKIEDQWVELIFEDAWIVTLLKKLFR